MSAAGSRFAHDCYVPVPVRVTVCGLVPSLSLTTREPGRLPTCVGVNVTVIVHFAPPTRPEPQSLVWLKGPEMDTPPMLRVVFPRFVSLIVFGALGSPTGWFPKSRFDAGEKLSATPAPCSRTVCGLPRASSKITRLPRCVPDMLGALLTYTLQLERPARVVPQVLV